MRTLKFNHVGFSNFVSQTQVTTFHKQSYNLSTKLHYKTMPCFFFNSGILILYFLFSLSDCGQAFYPTSRFNPSAVTLKGTSTAVPAAHVFSEYTDAIEAFQESNVKRIGNPVKRKRWATLSLDGGGARGLITAYVLKEVEDEIHRQTKNDNIKLGEVFDVIAGTSTGSILAMYLTASCLTKEKVRMGSAPNDEVILDGSADSAIKMYTMFLQDIFGKEKMGFWSKLFHIAKDGALHSAVPLEKKLKEAFGHLTLTDLAEKDKIVDGKKYNVASFLAVTYDMTFRRPAMFIADRMTKCARFVALDPFTEVYGEGGFPFLVDTDKAKKWHSKLMQAHQEYTKNHEVPFGKDNLGDLQAPMAPHLPMNHAMWSRSRDQKVDISLDKICRFSAAAPVYFLPGRTTEFFQDNKGVKSVLECTDGGLVANVPAQAASTTMGWLRVSKPYADFLTKHKADSWAARGFRDSDYLRQQKIKKDQMILSIGCGQIANNGDSLVTVEPEVANGFLGKLKSAVTYPIRGTQNYISMIKYLAKMAKDVIGVLMSSNSQISHVILEGDFSSDFMWQNYLRIQLSGTKNPDQPGFIKDTAMLDALDSMDTATTETLEQYKKAGEYLANVYKPLIKEFVTKMLEK